MYTLHSSSSRNTADP